MRESKPVHEIQPLPEVELETLDIVHAQLRRLGVDFILNEFRDDNPILAENSRKRAIANALPGTVLRSCLYSTGAIAHRALKQQAFIDRSGPDVSDVTYPFAKVLPSTIEFVSDSFACGNFPEDKDLADMHAENEHLMLSMVATLQGHSDDLGDFNVLMRNLSYTYQLMRQQEIFAVTGEGEPQPSYDLPFATIETINMVMDTYRQRQDYSKVCMQTMLAQNPKLVEAALNFGEFLEVDTELIVSSLILVHDPLQASLQSTLTHDSKMPIVTATAIESVVKDINEQGSESVGRSARLRMALHNPNLADFMMQTMTDAPDQDEVDAFRTLFMLIHETLQKQAELDNNPDS